MKLCVQSVKILARVVSVSDASVIKRRKKEKNVRRREGIASSESYNQSCDFSNAEIATLVGVTAVGKVRSISEREMNVRSRHRLCLPQPIIGDYPFIYLVPCRMSTGEGFPTRTLHFYYLKKNIAWQSSHIPAVEGRSDKLSYLCSSSPSQRFQFHSKWQLFVICHEVIELTFFCSTNRAGRMGAEDEKRNLSSFAGCG